MSVLSPGASRDGRRSPLPGRAPAHAGSASRQRREAGLAYLLLAPSALLLGTFGFFPLVYAFILSLRDKGPQAGAFVGPANYGEVLRGDPDFWHSLGVTLYYALGTVPATLILGYVLAELLHAQLRARGLYRVLFFMPYIVSPVAAAAIWRWIFDTDYGLANALLRELHAQRLEWLNEPAGVLQLLGSRLGWHVPGWAHGPSLALVCIMIVSVWQGLGFAVVVLLAGLAGVPSEVMEAARIDGATGWALIRRVKLPLLSPTLFFLLVVFTIRAFQTFTQLYVLTPDSSRVPNGSTCNVTLYIYLAFREYSRLGPAYGSTIAFILFLIIVALTLAQFRLLGRSVHYR